MNKSLLTAVVLAAVSLPALATNDNYRQIDNQNYLFQEQDEWKEGTVALPPYPVNPEWVGFFVPLQPDYKFFVDARTLTLDENDHVIRFILRIVSKSGAENLSYEGIQCGNRNTRAYAFGNSVDKTWIESSRALWKHLDDDSPVRRRLADNFCPRWERPRDAAEALQRLKTAPWH